MAGKTYKQGVVIPRNFCKERKPSKPRDRTVYMRHVRQAKAQSQASGHGSSVYLGATFQKATPSNQESGERQESQRQRTQSDMKKEEQSFAIKLTH